MQVVSVGAGKGRGKEIPTKMRGGKKPTASRPQTSSSPPQSSSPKPSEEAEPVTQLNGSSAPSIGQPADLPLASPIPCALASRDNQSQGEEGPCCLDCPDGALQKEE